MVQYIANIGFNHNGDVDGMKTILKICKEEGFDLAKFNVKKNTGKFEFDIFELTEIFQYANKINFKVYPCCFDIESINYLSGLTDTCEIPIEKMHETDFINYVRSKFEKIIFDINNLDIDYIENLFYSHGPFLIMYYTGNNNGKTLKNLLFLKNKYAKLKVGLCTDKLNDLSNIVGITNNIDYIQKNITLCRDLNGDNHVYALEPNEYRQFIKKMKEVENIL